MTDLNRMLVTLEELRAKSGNIQKKEMRLRPDDLEALKCATEPLLTHKFPGIDHGMSFMGVKLISDESAPPLPRKTT